MAEETGVVQPEGTASEGQTPEKIIMDHDELVTAVRKQIEYYFSKENLQTDSFLISQMDANMSVPIPVVMKFQKLKALTQDKEIIAKALENSSLTVVDGRIKSSVKSGARSTIILREIPSDAPNDEVKDIFNYEGAKPVSSIRSDIGDTWFITMESEEDAKDTLIDLRVKKRTFRGNPVRGRMKTETIVRSFYPVQPTPAPVVYPGMGFPYGAAGGMPMDPRAFGYGMNMNGMMSMNNGMMPPMAPNMAENGKHPQSPSSVAAADENSASNGMNGVNNRRGDQRSSRQHTGTHGGANTHPGASPSNINSKGAAGGAANAARGERKGSATGNASSSNAPGSAHGATPARSKDNSSQPSNSGEKKSNASRGDRRKDGTGGSGSGAKTISPEISAANFPPLPGADADAGVVPTPGYKGPYNKYTHDDILEIVKNIKDAHLPDGVQPGDHQLAMSSEPNSDLLQRQRTLSIDETREQLRQGRPVQRDAIIPGAVDYGNMVFGDGYASVAAGAPSLDPAAASATAAKTVASVAAKAMDSSSSSVDGSVTQAAAAVEGLNVSAPTAPAPASGDKKPAGSWAALVMSSTPAPAADAAPKVGAPRVVSSVSASAQKAAADKKEASTNGNKDNGKKGDRERRRGTGPNERKSDDKKKESSKDTRIKKEGDKDGELENGSASARVQDTGAATEAPSAAAASASTSASAPSWGGKPTFANIIKMKQQESDATAAAPAAKPSVPAGVDKDAARKDKEEPLSSAGRTGSGDRRGGSDRAVGSSGADKKMLMSTGVSTASSTGTWARAAATKPLASSTATSSTASSSTVSSDNHDSQDIAPTEPVDASRHNTGTVSSL